MSVILSIPHPCLSLQLQVSALPHFHFVGSMQMKSHMSNSFINQLSFSAMVYQTKEVSHDQIKEVSPNQQTKETSRD